MLVKISNEKKAENWEKIDSYLILLLVVLKN